MSLSRTKTGDIAILSEAVLWGLFPIITTITYSTLTPMVSLFFSILFATVFFGIWVTYTHKWKELLDKTIWLDIFYITLILGVAFYCLFFFGLSHTTPGNASLVALLETFFSFLFFSVWQKESFSWRHIVGGILMLTGAVMILFDKVSFFRLGDILIIFAVAIAPLGNYFQRRVRNKASSETVMFARNLLALPFLFILTLIFSESISLPAVSRSLWFLFINGFFIFGFSKILWLEGIYRIPVPKANALASVSPIFTIIFAYIFLEQIPTVWQIGAFLPLAIGLILLTTDRQFSKAKKEETLPPDSQF